jgi:diadenosine tetraphosphatase ApaH/serine/threonine PP2A family protein phosphatase
LRNRDCTGPDIQVTIRAIQKGLPLPLSRLKSLFRSKTTETDASRLCATLAPDTPFYAIGDVHGQADQLEKLLEQIDQDRAAYGLDQATLLFIGDFIDRGANSAGVLNRLFALSKASSANTVCLMGNHEKMLLDFIDDPAGRGAMWLRFGGIQTLASYGITGVREKAPAEDLLEICDSLEAALPPDMLSWLRALPLSWHSGNCSCAHAAMNPARAPERQSERTLLWGHTDFMRKPRDDGHWVVHGHTIVKKPGIEHGRIAIDTGAYRSGPLTAAAISKASCRFLQAR